MRQVISLIVGIAVSGIVVGAQAPDPKKVEAGQKIFTDQKCGTCHAVKGVGGKGASALDKVGAKLSAADLRKWLTHTADMEAKLSAKPKMSMVPYMKSKKFSDADLDALVAYMQSLK